MKRDLEVLLSMLACPVTGDGSFSLEGDEENALLTTGAGTVYPIIHGIPRMLPPDLLGPFLRSAYPETLSNWPKLAAAVLDTPDPEPEILATLSAYSYQHVDMADEDLLREDWESTWTRFQPDIEPRDFAGKQVLEIGSGEGRHACLVGEHASLLVGLDLSRGVELARQRDTNPNSFYVQGDLRRPPFRHGAFDALYSNGVIHHTPDPAASFAAVSRLVRPGGGIYIWVYGLDDMRWTYRISHLTFLRPVTNRMPRAGQVGMAVGLTAAVELCLWLPARVLKKVGLSQIADNLPYVDAADKNWQYKLRRMFDRINPPITHYITQDELRLWFIDCTDVEIINADGQGWSARGLMAL